MSKKETREVVFKLVFERCVAGEGDGLSFDIHTEGMDDETRAACRTAFDLIAEKSGFLTGLIEKYSCEFSIERIYKVDLAILTVAACEILFTDVPYKVAANEAVELAKRYSTEKSFKFINGVLSSVINDMDDIKQLYNAQ